MKRAKSVPREHPSAKDHSNNALDGKSKPQRPSALAFGFDAIYESYRSRVFSWCFGITHNVDDAQDLTQETFLQLFRKIDTFRGDSAFSTWLYRLTINLALMRLRRKGPPHISLEDISEADQRAIESRQSVDRTLTASIARADLGRAFDSLSPGFRTAVLLHDREQYTHEEVSELTGWAIGTSKSQLHKARQRLRELLRDRWEYRGDHGGNYSNRGGQYERPCFRAFGSQSS